MALTKWDLGGSADSGYAPAVKCGDLPDLTPTEASQKRVVNPNNFDSPDKDEDGE